MPTKDFGQRIINFTRCLFGKRFPKLIDPAKGDRVVRSLHFLQGSHDRAVGNIALEIGRLVSLLKHEGS
ncbi:hypothetical protein [Nostoc sp.]|uniref:hypothetical protein n=1 Tax=Nostoc sp. TaxID=1180 RepID=UPI002FFCE4FF